MPVHTRNSVTLLATVVCTVNTLLAGPICFEGESATQVAEPMEISGSETAKDAVSKAALKDASGKKALDIRQGKGNPPKVTTGKAEYQFDVAADGEYFLWCRVWWLDECANSFTMNLDEARSFTFGQDGTYKSWHWVKAPPRLKQLSLSKGRHKLVVACREDGAMLDQVILTTNKRYVPVGIESPSK
jgi:hypothetical protein